MKALAPVRVIAMLLVAALVALVGGILAAVRVLGRTTMDGHVTLKDQADVETATWKPVWAILRKLPLLKVD